MTLRKRFASGKIAAVAAVVGALTINPAMADGAPLVYMESTNDAAVIQQILAAGDEYGLTWEGIPDGMGAVRNSDGTVTIFVNHELSASDSFISMVERNYGGFGSNITAIKYDPETQEIIKITNAIKDAVWYDYTTSKYGDTPEAPEYAPNVDAYATPNHSKALNRFCSASLVDAGGLFFKNKSGKYGTKDPVFLTGEEGGDESRAFGLNITTKQLAQLPALGLGAVENVAIADVKETKKSTVAVLGEDGESTSSQLFVYKGTKTKTGAWYKRAGLTNGLRYVTQVLNSGTTFANDYAIRTAMASKTIVSATKGATPVATTKVKIVEGQLTITTAAAHNIKVGDKVTLSGFGSVTDANSATVDLSGINGVATAAAVGSTTAFTFGVDLDNLTETAYTNGAAAIGANQVVVTTSAAHGLIEGDTVAFDGNEGISGRYVITGVPTGSTTVFTVKKTGDAFSTTGGSVNEIMDVEFKKVPTDLAGDAQQVIAQLRGTVFARVEDLSFNPANPNELFFITTQSDSATAGTGFPGVGDVAGRDGGGLWKLTFIDVAHPELGANLELILDGTEAPINDGAIKLNKPDNMTFSADGNYIMIQEDPGSNSHIARLLALRLSDGALVSVAQFDSDYVSSSSVDTYLTNDEESSGIFDATKYFKMGDSASYFVFNAQLHPVTKDGSGNTLGSDPLKARAAALFRPDLIAQTNFTITNINHAASSTTMTVSVTDTGELAANDIVTIFGGTAEVNGTYSVTAVNAEADTFTVTVKNTVTLTGDLNSGNGLSANAKAITTSTDADLAFKGSVFEGGGLYTLKIEDWDALFTIAD
jgi:hypothetical protein